MTNALFVYKYSSRITSQFWAISLLYLIVVGLLVLLLYRKTESALSSGQATLIYFSLIALLAISLYLVMSHFDPEGIRVGRYPAMHDWISRFLNSEFPYASPTRPSGFPFLFVMAMPFYLLGDLGFFQIFSFFAFSVLVHLRDCQKAGDRYRRIFLLVTSPIFLYEIAVRSDLFSNMVMIMLYLAILELRGQGASHASLCVLGIAGGLLLSTRGVALLIYIAVLGYLCRRQTIKCNLFLPSVVAGFLISLVPLLVWNWECFIGSGPFTIQLSLIPNWLLIPSIISSVCCALTVGSLKRIYSCVAFILFGVTCVAFILSIFDHGWYQAIFGDRFDISYFCFALPFLLISLDLPGKEAISSDRTFAIRPTEGGARHSTSPRLRFLGLLRTGDAWQASRHLGTDRGQPLIATRTLAGFFSSARL